MTFKFLISSCRLFLKTGIIIFSIFIFSAILFPSPQYLKKFGIDLLSKSSTRIFILGFYNNPYVFIKLYEFDTQNGRFELAEEDLNLALGVCNRSCYYYEHLITLKNK